LSVGMPSLFAFNTTNSSFVGDMLELSNTANSSFAENRDLTAAAAATVCTMFLDHNDENGDSNRDHEDDEDGNLKDTGNLKTGGDIYEEPNAKTIQKIAAKIIKKKDPGGAFSPSHESLGILQDFMSKQASPLFARQAEQDASSPTGENNDFVEEEGGGGQYDQYDDDELFQDDVEQQDMSHYCSETVGRSGRPLIIDGGPPKPNTDDMTAAGAVMAIIEWRVQRKAFRDNKIAY
jgi:hypothetical protein